MKKRIAIVSHDAKKLECAEWVKYNKETLKEYDLVCTGTTGKIVEEILEVPVERLKSGPLGGDQQIGAMIADGKIDFLVFFCDPLSIQSHYQDIGALERISVLYNIPFAANRCTADMILSSALFTDETYKPAEPDFSSYLNRAWKK